MEEDAGVTLAEAMETDQDDSKILDTDPTVEDITKELEDGDELPPLPNQLDIARAQQDLDTTDVLVCGGCHLVFHFVEEFQLHKASECTGVRDVNNVMTKPDSKAEVWAFVLYKTTKLKEMGPDESDWSSSSWKLYQKWSKLEDRIKASWVEAGRTVQQLSSILPQKQEPVKPLSTPKGRAKQIVTLSERDQEQQTLIALQKQLEDGESQMMNSLGLVREGNNTIRLGPNQMWKKRKDSDDEELMSIEKIVAKRMNPKSRHPEYLVKWEGYPSDQNTWEQLQDMNNCMKLIQEFEKSLAKQKARKALEASKLAAKNAMRIELTPTQLTQGRPVRNSAKKALDQVKEWVGSKRKFDSDEESEEELGKRDTAAELSAILKRKAQPGGKPPVVVANSRGVVRVDPKTVPNLTSGVYILSTQSGLIKVDEPTASKLTEAMKLEGRKIPQADSKTTMMIHETEVRKIPAGNATPKVNIVRKEFVPSTIIKKETNPTPPPKIIQKLRTSAATPPIRLGTPLRQQSSALSRQIILGKNKPRPLPGPVPSPLRPPNIRQKLNFRPVTAREKVVEDDFDGGIPDEFPKEDEPIAPPSPTRPLTLCPQSGEVLGRAEGEKTPPPEEEMVAENESVMRVEMSPGGTLRQIISPQRPKQRSLLNQRRQKMQAEVQEQEMISLEGNDILYITPEQQEQLLLNGTLTMHDNKSDEVSTVVLPQESLTQEQTELLIKNGQIVERHLVSDEVEGENSEEHVLVGGETFIEGEDGGVYSNVLTLDSAVQEAISPGGVEQADASKADDNQHLVAQIIQADPPTPGGGPRKVVLLLPDGSLVNTEMSEEEYQALDMDK